MTALWRRRSEPYDGLEVRCAPGVHERCAALVRLHAPPPARILDLAAGSGAFLARLRDAGYRNLAGVERDLAAYALSEVPCRPLDLDQPFATALTDRYDLVTAIEIIEHLSSPIGFLREARKLLAPGGLVVVSTPNVAEWQSRIRFLWSGRPRYFDEAQYRFQRHITPVLPALVPFMLEEAGFELVTMTTAGSFDGPLRRLTLGAAASVIASLRGDPLALGDCLVVIARSRP